MNSTAILVCIVFVELFKLGVCTRYCSQDTDCEDLGDLLCIKSMCTWGVCGCKRGYASRFVGSSRKFQCVKIKKIGDKCSTKGTDGVCGAENSSCVDEKCQCDSGTEPRWDGETCLTIKTSTLAETCSVGIGTCDTGSCQADMDSLGSYTGLPLSGLTNSPFDEVPSACACGTGYTTALSNDYDIAPFMGKMRPICRPNTVGDLCLRDADCGQIRTPTMLGGWTTGDAECVANKCVCPTSLTYTSDITGLYCATGINVGGACAWSNELPDANTGVCDGTVGLRCGDPCDVATFDGSGNHTCVCDPGWISSSGSCSKKIVGSTCYGDHNCKSLNPTAVCIDGLCQNSARSTSGSSVRSAIVGLLVIVLCSSL